MSEAIENNKAVAKRDEIDFIEVLKKIRESRKIIYKTVVICFILGLVSVLGTPNEYKSEIVLVVETRSKVGGMSGLLQQFGGLAGINLNTMTGDDALNPQLYPDVIKSTPFLLEIMGQRITDSKYDSTITVAKFLDYHSKKSLLNWIKNYTIGLPGKIKKLVKGSKKPQINYIKPDSSILRITQEQYDIAEKLLDCIVVKEDKLNNTLKISVEVQDPLVAAQITDSVSKTLSKYIIDYRTQKVKADLAFIKERHKEAEEKYIWAQEALAAFNDRNKNLILSSARVEEQRLQSQYNLAFNIYNTLSQQLEQAKIKVQENTPVFKIIEPAKVPLQKSKPKTLITLIIMLFLGGFLGIGIIYGKLIYESYFRS